MDKRFFSLMFLFFGAVALVAACEEDESSSVSASRKPTRELIAPSAQPAQSGSGAHNSLDAQPSNSGLAAGNQLTAPNDDLVDKFIRLRQSIGERYHKLNREKDRRGKLQSELRINLDRGCWADEKIERLEIKIRGDDAGDKNLGEFDSPEGFDQEEGKAQSFVISFGDIGVTNNEKVNSLFNPAGHLVSSELRDYTISQMQQISFRKSGQYFRTNPIVKGGSWFTKTKTVYIVKETFRYVMFDLEILVNGQTVYQQAGIDHTFEKGGLEYRISPEKLQNNPAWIRLMQRQDCSLTQ